MIQKEFNVNDAKRIQNNEIAGEIKTKDGMAVTILSCNVKSFFPIAGIVHLGDNNDYVRQWTIDGKSFPHKRASKFDLVIEIEEDEYV